MKANRPRLTKEEQIRYLHDYYAKNGFLPIATDLPREIGEVLPYNDARWTDCCDTPLKQNAWRIVAEGKASDFGPFMPEEKFSHFYRIEAMD